MEGVRAESNWVRRIAGMERIDKRRMEELREEGVVKESLTRKLVWTRGTNGRITVDEEGGCAERGEEEDCD